MSPPVLSPFSSLPNKKSFNWVDCDIIPMLVPIRAPPIGPPGKKNEPSAPTIAAAPIRLFLPFISPINTERRSLADTSSSPKIILVHSVALALKCSLKSEPIPFNFLDTLDSFSASSCKNDFI